MSRWWKDCGPQSIAVATIVLAIAGAGVGATWKVSGTIAEVRADLSGEIADTRAEIAALDARLSGFEAKLDLLIEGLNIKVSGPARTANR